MKCSPWKTSLDAFSFSGIRHRDEKKEQILPNLVCTDTWFWVMKADYCKLNPVMIFIVSTVPDVVHCHYFLFLSRLNLPGTWYTAIDLADTFLLYVCKSCRKQSVFTWQGQQYTFIVPPQGYFNSPTLCHKLVLRGINHFSFIMLHTGLLW